MWLRNMARREEINRKHINARKMENLFKIVQERNPEAIKDLNWLIEQRDGVHSPPLRITAARS